jgi:uncharacterized protein YbbC (DUF1343 family)
LQWHSQIQEKMHKKYSFTIILIATCLVSGFSCNHQPTSAIKTDSAEVFPTIKTVQELIPGAYQLESYLPKLKDKRVALVVNHTSLINQTHLADTLLSLKVNVKKIFAPEHGFRGIASAGEKINSGIDEKTGLPLISLYGSTKKPSPEMLQDIDIVIFDIQDVGVRFYTYISTMHYVMEACAENNKELLVLDRPNPNGYYIAGPVLKPEFKSFVGMHPIPIVHGLTVGELALMINGEYWLTNKLQCKLEVVKVKNYTHKDRYSLPIKPSPNLPNDLSIQLYPYLGLFEGTNISVGRGTEMPFQIIGSPNPKNGSFIFTPKSMEGAKNPPHQDQKCYGIDFRANKPKEGFHLQYLIMMYNASEDKEKFFNNFLEKLTGTETLRNQIKEGLSEEKIKASWEADLIKYKTIRKKYLLYNDFE